MGVGQNLFMFGLHYSTSTNTSLLSTLIPVITFILGAFSGREKISTFKIVGLFLAFSGVIVLKDLSLSTFGLDTIKGDLLVLLGCVCFAYFLISSRVYAQKIDQIWLTAICFGISGLALLPFNLHKLSVLAGDFNLYFWQCFVFSIVGATVITYFLNNWCLKRIESSKVALFIYIQPIVTAIVAFFTLNELSTKF
jgi:drug/metabolite transporter (DMT)-like permease